MKPCPPCDDGHFACADHHAGICPCAKQGLARAKREGWPKGRPGRKPKPSLSPEEAAYVREQRERRKAGLPAAGYGRMAAELTRRRGALEVVDPKARDRRTVTPSWLRSEVERIESGPIVRTWRKRRRDVAGSAGTEPAPTGGSDQVAAGGGPHG